MTHKPVLVSEVLQYLALQANENVIDGTVGQGGHAKLILEKINPSGKLLGMDWDAAQIENSRKELEAFGNRVMLENGSYTDMKVAAEKHGLQRVDGILLDLGYSSWHIEDSKKGFSFQKDEALDMRYGNGELTAENIVNTWSEKELEKIVSEYGEDDFARQIARKIVEARRKSVIKSTFQLVEIIKQAIPGRFQYGGIHYATRTFQALRIAVNAELENITRGLEAGLSILSPGGRMVIISFHSLEDRIVKNFLRDQEKAGAIEVLTKKPVTGTPEEINQNPRARSAKLRAFLKAKI